MVNIVFNFDCHTNNGHSCILFCYCLVMNPLQLQPAFVFSMG